MTDITLGSMMMEDHGQGASVVMIHGLGGTSGSFQTLMPDMKNYRVLRPDLPGAGRSSLRPGCPGLKGLAGAVKELLDSAGITRAHFVGHSMGTLVCQVLAADRPDMVSAMTLFGPILEPSVAARQALIERASMARDQGMTEIADAVSNSSISPGNPAAAAFVRESLLRQDPAGYAAHCEALSRMEVPNHGSIHCPTLLIAGENDPVAPVTMAQQLQQKIERSRLEIVPDAAHWPMIEAPALSAQLLCTHLDECGKE